MKKLLCLSIFAVMLLVFTAPASATPTLITDKPSVFEFNSWEYVVTHDGRPFDPTDAQALQKGDMFEGVFDLDSITDGTSSYYDPEFSGTEITGFFTGMVIDSIVTVDLDSNGIPEHIYADYTFTSDATVEVYFDEDNDLDLSDPVTAVATAIDGTKLLKLDWGEFRTSANSANTATTDDDVTDGDGHLNVADDPLNEWLWNKLFLQGIYEWPIPGNFYDFVFQDDIFAPNHKNFTDNANYWWDHDSDGTTPDVRAWDFYNTDDLRGQAVPEPASMLLLGSGLIGLAGWSRKKMKK